MMRKLRIKCLVYEKTGFVEFAPTRGVRCPLHITGLLALNNKVGLMDPHTYLFYFLGEVVEFTYTPEYI